MPATMRRHTPTNCARSGPTKGTTASRVAAARSSVSRAPSSTRRLGVRGCAARSSRPARTSGTCDEALRFYRDRGFGADAGHDEFTLYAPPVPCAAIAGLELVPPDPAWRDAIGELHQTEFPGGYVTADSLFALPVVDRCTRIALVGGRPAGYIHAHFDAQWQEGYVDFLAVAPWARGRGVGRALLQAAADWSFGPMRARAVTLTVRADREAARALYLAAGFACVRRGIGLQRQRNA